MLKGTAKEPVSPSMTKTDQVVKDAEEVCDWFREQGERFEEIEDEMTGDEPDTDDALIALKVFDAPSILKGLAPRPPPPCPPRPGSRAMELAEELAARDREFVKLSRELAEVKEKLRHVIDQLQQERASRTKKPRDTVTIRFLRPHQGRRAGEECGVSQDLARSWCDVPGPPAERI